MEGVVEAAHAAHVALVHGVAGDRAIVVDGEGAHPVVDAVVVVGIVLEGGQREGPPAGRAAQQAQVALVGVERAIGIGGIEGEGPGVLRGDDVDDAAYGIGAEGDGHDALVHLDTLGIIDGQVVQAHGRAAAFVGHAVHEDADVAAAEAVDEQVAVGAHTAALPQSEAGQGADGRAATVRSMEPTGCRPKTDRKPTGMLPRRNHYYYFIIFLPNARSKRSFLILIKLALQSRIMWYNIIDEVSIRPLLRS